MQYPSPLAPPFRPGCLRHRRLSRSLKGPDPAALEAASALVSDLELAPAGGVGLVEDSEVGRTASVPALFRLRC
jgi:hypothetical protein